ncbi:MAG: methylthioribulose 1-phosphate dehydratase [Candidatus Velthaea sp.]
MTGVLVTPPQAIVDAIAGIGRFAAARGWVPATSGNFSCRLDDRFVAITRSGVDKGNLGPADIVVLALDEPIPPGVSAETPLHLARYRADPAIGAIVHVHTVAATVLSRLHAEQGVLELYGFEMEKSLRGVTTHETDVPLPIFANAQDTAALAAHVEERLGSDPAAPGYLLAGHGLYAWGATMDDARRHLEGLEFLLACTLEERRLAR